MEAWITHDHAASPEYDDGCQEAARPQLPQYHSGRWLKEHIWNEEYEHDQAVLFTV